MTVTGDIHSRELSCLANFRPLCVRVHCLFFVTSVQEASVCASVMTTTHRDQLLIASTAQKPEIQHLVSQSQIVCTVIKERKGLGMKLGHNRVTYKRNYNSLMDIHV